MEIRYINSPSNLLIISDNRANTKISSPNKVNFMRHVKSSILIYIYKNKGKLDIE
jgi:hypothetical protein